ncbi:mitochondrial 54S ribosomal protein bL33m [Magnusiomyces paraingens]|uniref:Large ribosomal subunit protein bL33m n=1 Tax=Magnusiomyces paraingens TaxID=2606893 RepID=A0A5E8AYW2_9ASCO|nr:uncharacterized protein SAPINGB_P000231 [Saprochaete ingens]VVT43958.1 unnamed protein product [Saprochaete ingens]
MVSKAKGRYTLIKLISTAKTGYIRYVQRPRSSPIVTQVRYDPIAQRHVLFEESKKRKVAEKKPLVFA